MNLSDQEGDTRIEYVSAPPQPPSSVATGRSQTSQLLTHVQVTDYLVVLRQYGVLRYHQLWEVEGSLRELVTGLVNSVEADGLRDQRWLDLGWYPGFGRYRVGGRVTRVYQHKTSNPARDRDGILDGMEGDRGEQRW